MDPFRCSECFRSFTNEFNYTRHIDSGVCKLKKKNLFCEKCQKYFGRAYSLKRHIENVHERKNDIVSVFKCGICELCFESPEDLKEHRRSHVFDHEFKSQESAHYRQCESLRLYLPDHVNTLDEGFFYSYQRMVDLVKNLLIERTFFKISFCLNVEMYRMNEEGNIEQMEIFPFRGFATKVSRTSNFEYDLTLVCGDIERNVDEFLFQGSGWIVNTVLYMDAEVAACEPLAGSVSCAPHEMGYVRRRGLAPAYSRLGDDSSDCFYTAVASHFCIPGAQESMLQDFINTQLRRNERKGPVAVDDIQAFEKNNQHLDLAINVVYRDEDRAVLPVYASKNIHAANQIVLVLFHVKVQSEFDEAPRDMQHYGLARDPSRLFAKRVADEDTGKVRTVNVYICWNCFNKQYSKGAHEAHVLFCHKNDCQRIIMPEEGEVRSFTSQEKSCAKSFKSAFMLFFDFEALQIPAKKECSCSEEVLENTRRLEKENKNELNPLDETLNEIHEHSFRVQDWEGECFDRHVAGRKLMPTFITKQKRVRAMKVCKHKTKSLKEQPPFAYNFVLLDREGAVREEKTYMGLDAAENFVRSVLDVADKYLPTLSPGIPMNPLTAEEMTVLQRQSICYLCNEHIDYGNRVLDHDHLTGDFLGVAHNACNLQRKEQIRLTCFAHNFSGYDSHFLVQAFNKFPERIRNLFAIPLSMQKFKCFNVNSQIQFIDSLAFLPDSLSNLTNMLRESKSRFPILQQLVHNLDGNWAEAKRMLLRKGVYPYSFATSIEVLKNADKLPSIDNFTSDLTGEECSDEDYAYAHEVWNFFDCRNMLEYTMLYMKTDVRLLADVVMDFRNMIWQKFELDICQYLSLPHLAMDTMLKTTGVEIELLHDQGMADLVRSNIRGGHSFVNRRHVVDDAEHTLLYVDANNLYGNAMQFPLPMRDFRWMTEEEIANFDAMADVTVEDGDGYILEVDLDYPEELHLKHNSFPLAAENLHVFEEDLSEYSKSCLKALGKTGKYKSEKLSATFRPRKNYLVHGLNLKLYLELGLKLTKIHSGIIFHQQKFTKKFIDDCSANRMEATTKTEQNMWKLICNSIYGKFIESSEKHMTCKFNTNETTAMRNTSSPLYKGTLICGDDLSISFHKKKHFKSKQCWAVGFSVLEISKYVMQSLYYKEIQPALGEGNVATVLSDTDSFVLVTNCKNEDEIMRKLQHVMDLSNLNPKHELYDVSRKKVPGFLKNEMPHVKILEAVALKSKTYSLRTATNDHNVAKGVQSFVKNHGLTTDSYRSCIQEMRNVEVTQHQLRSEAHVNKLMRNRKVAFSSFDDKRYLLCPVHSVPYGSVLMTSDKWKKRCYFCANPKNLT